MVKNRLKEIRMKEYAMERQEFAKYLGVTNASYYNWESGLRVPTLEKAIEIANKINKTVNEVWYIE